MRDFDVTSRKRGDSPSAGYFAVFVDRDPIPPGKTIEWYATEEDSCGDSPCESVENGMTVVVIEHDIPLVIQ